jgi:hypothetical protein
LVKQGGRPGCVISPRIVGIRDIICAGICQINNDLYDFKVSYKITQPAHFPEIFLKKGKIQRVFRYPWLNFEERLQEEQNGCQY